MADRPLVNTTLADVMPSALGSLGLQEFANSLNVPSSQRVVVLLVDGMGFQALQDFPELAPWFSRADGSALMAAFPTTTPTGLASLGTGSLPGHHGFVGASFWLPDEEVALHPLHWGSMPQPEAVQPESTMFEVATRNGVSCSTIGPSAYQASGLTRSVLRGAQYVCAESIPERVACLTEQWQGVDRALTYMYWAPVDRIGHESGVGSHEWRDALSHVSALIEGIRRVLGPHDTLIVTADHGMVNVQRDNRIDIDAIPALWRHVTRVLGEPRMRHVYVEDPASLDDVRSTWQDVLGDRADVKTRGEVINSGLWGAVEPGLEERSGDLLVVASGSHALTSARIDARVSNLIGQHGALSPEELLVPGCILTSEH